MIPRSLSRIAVIAAGSLALAHCAQYPAGGARERATLLDQQTVRLAAQAQQAVLKHDAPLDRPALQHYVDAVGQRLAKQSEHPALPWHFTVVDSADVNTFSTPGGEVYVTRGLLAYLNTEAELAAVLGHEIGHVDAGDGLGLPSVPAPTGLRSALAPVTAADGSLRALEQAWVSGYGRARELEADRRGARYLAAAGYDPQAMVDALRALETVAASAAARDASVPRSYHASVDGLAADDAQIEQGVAAARRSRAAAPREGGDDYLRHVAGLVFGDSPDQGLLRNNLLLHPKLGLALQFPPGWTVRNRPDRVVATSADGEALIELQPGPQNDMPLDTLQKGLRLDPGARFDSGKLSGYPAAFVAGAQDGQPLVAAAVVFQGTQYVIAGKTRDTLAYERTRGALRAAINSFRAITPAEKLAARAHVLQVHSARPGLTMADYARQSPLGEGAERQLRLLNHLYPGGEPTPGQLLKIVE